VRLLRRKLLHVRGATWPVRFRALPARDRPSRTAKFSRSGASMSRISEFMSGFPRLAGLMGSHPLRLPNLLPSSTNSDGAMATKSSRDIPAAR
jgi:hypothetical protein